MPDPSYRILLIGTDRSHAVNLQDTLNGSIPDRFLVEFANVFSDTFKHFIQPYPEIVILDWDKPENQAQNLLATIRTKAPRSALLVYSASTDDDMAINAIRAGADDFLSRPAGGFEKSAVRVIRCAIEKVMSGHIQIKNINELEPFIVYSRDGIVVFDENGSITVWNKALENITGISAGSALNIPWWKLHYKLLAPKTQKKIGVERIKTAIQEMFRTGILLELNTPREVEILSTNGKKSYISLSAFPIKTQTGFRIAAIIRDITEQKFATEALRESENRMNRVFQSNPVAQLIATLGDGLINDANTSFCELSGYQKDDLIGRTAFEFGFWANSLDMHAMLREIRSTGHVYNLETEFRNRAGNLFTLLISSEKIIFNNVECVLSTGVDISDRKQAVTDLHESEQRYRSLFKNNHASMLIIDPATGNIVDANPSAARFYGWSEEELCKRKISEINILTPAEVEQEMAKARAAEKNHFIFKHKLANGVVRDVDVYSGSITIKSRELLFSIIHDITDRIKAESALRESEVRFSSIYNHSPLGIVITRLSDGNILEANSAFLNHLEYSRDEIIGKTALELGLWQKPADREKMVAAINLTNSKPVDYFETSYQKKSGSIMHVLVSAEALLIDGEACMITQFIDITERNQAEKLANVQHDLARNVSTITSYEEAWPLCIDGALQVSDMDCGGIYLFDNNHEQLEIVYHQGLSVQFVQNASVYFKDSPNVKMVLEGKLIYLSEIELFENPLLLEEGLHSLTIVPIIDQDVVLGCMNLASHTLAQIPESAHTSLEAIAPEIGNIIIHLRAQISLQESEEKYHSLVDSQESDISTVDSNGVIHYINQIGAKSLGYLPAEIIGKSLQDLLPEDLAKWQLEQVRTTILSAGGRVSEKQVNYGGKTAWKLISIQPIRNANGKTILAMINSLDISERKRAEDDLERNSQLLHESQSIANIGSWTADLRKNTFDASPEGAHLLGWEAGIHHMQELIDTIHPDDRGMMSAAWEASKHGKPFDVEHRIIVRGDVRWLHIKAKFNFEANGTAVNVLGIFQDITDTRNADAALAESEARFRRLAENSTTLIYRYELHPRMGFTFVNPASSAMVGYSPEEHYANADLGWIKLIHPDDRHLLEDMIRSEENIDKPLVLRWMHKNGNTLWVEQRNVPIYDQNHNLIALEGIAIDINDRIKADEELHRMERRYRALIEYAPDGIVLVSGEGLLVYASKSVERIFGYQQSEIQLINSVEFTHPDDRERVLATLAELMQRQDYVPTLQYRFLHKNGGWRWIESTFSNMLAVPNVDAIVINFHDITERKRVEMELQESNETAQAILNAAVEPVFLLDVVGNIIACNETTARRFGMQITDLVGINLYTLLPLESSQNHRYKLEKSMRDKIPIIFDDEQTGIWWENSIYPIVDQDGIIRRIAVYEKNITERKKMEADLHKTYALLNEAQRIGHIGHMEWSATGNSLVCSEELYNIFELPNGEPIFQDVIATMMVEGDRERLKGIDQKAFSEHTDMSYEYRIRTLDERERWLHQQGKVTYSDTGQPVRMMAIIQDITEFKNIEKELRQSEEKYRGLMESLDSVVATVDQNGRFLYLNDIAAEQLGSKADMLIGKYMHDLFPEKFAEYQLFAIQNVIKHDKPTVFEAQTYAHGQPRWHRTSMQPIHNERGAVTHVLVNSTDIDDLKTAQQKMEELNRTLEERVEQRTAEVQDLYDNAPAGYHSLDSDGRVLLINQTELTWLRMKKEDVIGHRMTEFFTPESRVIFQATFAQFKEQGWIKDLELEFALQDGTIKPITISGIAAYDANNNYVMSRSTVFDNTEHKAVDEALRHANQELERALRMKDEFLANMSHELRTPLNGILGLSEILLDGYRGPLNEFQTKYVRNIDTSGRHLLSLINDLLDLSKIEAGKLDLYPENVVISEICHASLAFIKEQASKKNISLEYMPETSITSLIADQRRLKQVLVNLLTNAVKFTPSGGRVTLQVQANIQNKSIDLSVMDTGIGISPENLERLFSPFTQVDSSLTRQNEGTGLGLALVKRLTELHNGKVHVTSKVGTGSRFTISIPWQPPEEVIRLLTSEELLDEKSTVKQVSFENLSYPGGNILLAEDNEINIITISAVLERTNFEVIVARNGIEALDLAEQKQPDLILMDIQMPYMDGLEATRHLRSNPAFKSTPIIAITALAMPGDRDRCLEAGVNEYFSKPISPKELIASIHKLLKYKNQEENGR